MASIEFKVISNRRNKREDGNLGPVYRSGSFLKVGVDVVVDKKWIFSIVKIVDGEIPGPPPFFLGIRIWGISKGNIHSVVIIQSLAVSGAIKKIEVLFGKEKTVDWSE